MADEGTGRPLGVSPSTEFAVLTGISATSPPLLVTATIIGSAQTVHTSDAQAIDVVFLQAFNNSGSSVTVYANIGSAATTTSIPLTLNGGTSGFLINGLPVTGGATVTVYNLTATNVVTVGGSVSRTFL